MLCNIYNHKPYLEDALRGFLIQKTTFPFEVILHDDASTDGVTDIVRQYAERYPTIIKPVIQTENQFSKGKKPSLLSFSHAKGEYIAMCEGDDFWISNEKLEQQYRLLVDQRSIMLSFHAAFMLFSNGKIKRYPIKIKKRVYSVSDMILGGGGLCPTPSLMMHSQILKNIPPWFANVPFGDFYLQVLGTQMGGGALYLNHEMSVYRVMSENNWSSKRAENAEKIFEQQMDCHPYLCEFLGNRYHDEMMVVKSKYAYTAARLLLREGTFSASIKYIKKSIKVKLFSPIRQFAVFISACLKIKV